MSLSSELLSHSVCPTAWTHREAGHLLAQTGKPILTLVTQCHLLWPRGLLTLCRAVSSALHMVLQFCIPFYKGERKGLSFVTPCGAVPTLPLYPALPVEKEVLRSRRVAWPLSWQGGMLLGFPTSGLVSYSIQSSCGVSLRVLLGWGASPRARKQLCLC